MRETDNSVSAGAAAAKLGHCTGFSLASAWHTRGGSLACGSSRGGALFGRQSLELLSTSYGPLSARLENNAFADKANVAIALPDDTERAREVIGRGRRIARYLGLEWIAVRVISGSLDAGDGEVRSESGRIGVGATRALLVIGCSRRPRLLRRLKHEPKVQAGRATEM